MKRMHWIGLFIGMLFITACTSRPAATLPATAAVVPVTVEPTSTSVQVLPTETPAVVIPVTGVTPEATVVKETIPSASVSADGLNLRVGPGLNYRILGVLSQGAQVRLSGRSQGGEWINIRTSNGTDGWVYGAYLSTEVEFSSLPVLEAYGGPAAAQPEPEAEASKPARYSFNVVIENNIASVTLTGLPAKRDILLRLGVRGGGQSMTVASGTTDAQGAAVLTFEMPGYWPDGSAVTQNLLVMVVETVDGSVSRSANITYYNGY